MRTFIIILTVLLTQSVHASLMSFSNDANENYWSSDTLGLDILRLSEVQTYITMGNLYNQMTVGKSLDGWRFATFTETSELFDFFDTDPVNDGWSSSQFDGSTVFNKLMGLSVAYTETVPRDNYGYDEYGHHAWSILQLDLSAYSQMSGYISVCDPSFNTTKNCVELLGQYADQGAGYLDLFEAGRLNPTWGDRSLRDNNGTFVVRNTISVTAPSTISLLLIPILLLFSTIIIRKHCFTIARAIF